MTATGTAQVPYQLCLYSTAASGGTLLTGAEYLAGLVSPSRFSGPGNTAGTALTFTSPQAIFAGVTAIGAYIVPDVTGQVAKSTHAGLPFLRRIRRALPNLHIWPFDGWEIPQNRSTLVEAYPRLYSAAYTAEDRTPDQHDAFATASWLRDADGQTPRLWLCLD